MYKQSVAHRILEALREAGGHGLTSVDLQTRFGTSAKSRIGDLRKKGFQIETIPGEICATYRLVSEKMVEEDMILAGVVIKYSTRKGWVMHSLVRDATVVPEEKQNQADTAVLGLYTRLLNPHLPRNR